MASVRLWPEGLPIVFQDERPDGFPYRSSLRTWTRTSNRGRCLAFCVPPLLVTSPRRNRNINLLSFAYAFRPPLRDRLTLGGLTFPRNPWAFGEQVFHLLSRYSCRHYLFRLVQPSSRSAFDLARNAPLPLLAEFVASVVCLAPLNCPRSIA